MCGVNKCRGYIRGDIDVGLRAAFFALHRPPHLPSVASLTWYRCQVNPRRSPREALACPRAPSPPEREAPLPPDASCGKGHLHHLAQTPREIQGGVPTRGQGEYAERMSGTACRYGISGMIRAQRVQPGADSWKAGDSPAQMCTSVIIMNKRVPRS